MNAHRRPGGLTALAVVNFIFGGLSVLGVLGYVGVMFLVNNPEIAQGAAGAPGGSAAQQAQLEALREMGQGVFLFLTICSVVSAALYIASGVGYLKLKRFLGRQLGNITALLSIVVSVGSAMFMAPQLGGGFNLTTVIGLIYPLLTLFFLNVTFKDDFVNP